LKHQAIVLASTSPRRVSLLKQLGIEFDVVDPKDVEKSNSKDPMTRAREHARCKAEAVAAKYPYRLIIAADTIVVIGGKILEKPRTEEEAKDMLRALNGRIHKVISAIVLIEKSRGILDIRTEETLVKIKKLDENEIESYVRTGESMDKAGAYAAQGIGAVLIERVNGCYNNIVGLPLKLLYEMLKDSGLNILTLATR
jgi:septum formation protein